MTAAMETPGTYASTAYRSNRKASMPDAPVEQSSPFRKSWTMGAPLSKGRLSGVFPPGFLDTWGPDEVREDEENLRKFKTEADQGGQPFEPVGWINGESIRYATLPKISWALLWMQHGGALGIYYYISSFLFGDGFRVLAA